MITFISSLAEQASIPSGFWEFIWSRLLLGGGSPLTLIVNYGVRVIVFTLFLKLILSPLDIYQRIRMKKNQQITESLKPEIEKLEKQFGGNPRVLQQKKQELNKKNGVKMMAGCAPMFVTMVVSIWVLMGGLNPISQYQNMMQYLHLFDAFTVAEQASIVDMAKSNREVFYLYDNEGNLIQDGNPNWDNVSIAVLRGPEAFTDIAWSVADVEVRNEAIAKRNQLDAYIQSASTKAGQVAVEDRYFGRGEWEGNPARDSFLWVQNIWVSDVPWERPIRNAGAFSSAVGRFRNPSNMGINYASVGFDNSEDFELWFENVVIGSYDRIMGDLFRHERNRRNGLLIIPILSIIVMIGSQILMRRLQKKSGQMPGMGGMGAMGGMFGGAGGAGGGMMGKVMAFAMPVMFGLFSLGFTAAFALYMVVNSTFMIVITLLSSGIFILMDKRVKKQKVTEVGAIKYGRRDPNEAQETNRSRKKK